MCISYTHMYVYPQKDTDRHVILNLSMPPAPPSLPEHYQTPISQQQLLHCAVMQVCRRCDLFYSKISRARTCQGRDKQATGHNLFSIPSQWPLWYCMH